MGQNKTFDKRAGLIGNGDGDDRDVQTGEKLMQSPITDTIYRVTRWIEQEDGKAVALDKEIADCGYCENFPAVEWSDQGKPQCVNCSPNRSTENAEENE